MSWVVLLNLLSIFLTGSSLKVYISSTIHASPIFYRLSPTAVLLQICPFSTAIFMDIALRKSGILFPFTHLNPFQVTLPNSVTLSHKSSFIPRTSHLWNSCHPILSVNPNICHLSNITSTNLILSPCLLNLLPFSQFFYC